jgi:hypothetical protein
MSAKFKHQNNEVCIITVSVFGGCAVKSKNAARGAVITHSEMTVPCHHHSCHITPMYKQDVLKYVYIKMVQKNSLLFYSQRRSV